MYLPSNNAQLLFSFLPFTYTYGIKPSLNTWQIFTPTRMQSVPLINECLFTSNSPPNRRFTKTNIYISHGTKNPPLATRPSSDRGRSASRRGESQCEDACRTFSSPLSEANKRRGGWRKHDTPLIFFQRAFLPSVNFSKFWKYTTKIWKTNTTKLCEK